MTMHRVQAGALDANGWVVASSTEGQFTVELPCQFNDFTVANQEGSANKVFVVGCKRSDGSKFSATRASYQEGQTAAQENFSSAAKKGLGSGSTTQLEGRGSDAAILSKIDGPSGCGWERVVRAGSDNVLLIAEGKGEACQTVESLVPRFFASLQAQSVER
jgi:hypothetical protein